LISLDNDNESENKKMYGKSFNIDSKENDRSAFPFLNADNDSTPLFPVLTKKDEMTPLIPNLSEMAGIKPLFPKQLGMLNHIRTGNIPSPFDYSGINASGFLHHPTHMASTMDFVARLRRNRLL